jgi:hypothetical protein
MRVLNQSLVNQFRNIVTSRMLLIAGIKSFVKIGQIFTGNGAFKGQQRTVMLYDADNQIYMDMFLADLLKPTF